MPDDDVMEMISKRSEVDPVFAEVAEIIFGDAVDVRELYDISKMGDSSEVHVPGNLQSPKNQKRKRALLAGGLLLGTAAEGLATKDAGFDAYKAFKAGARGRAMIRPGGKAALQAANMGVGLAAGNELAQLARPKKQVSKALTDALNEIITARREGQITTDTALALAEQVTGDIEKFWINPIGIIRSAKSAPKLIANNMAMAPKTRAARIARKATGLIPAVKTNRNAEAMRQLAADAPKAKRMALATSAMAGAGTGAYAGSALATRKANKQYGVSSVSKSEDLVDYAFTGEISKMDEDKRLAFGWCSLSEVDGKPVIDLQGDYAPIDEIEKSAYAYVVDSRVGGDMHAREGERARHTSDLVESFIATPEKLAQMGLSPEVAKSVPTGWWVGFKVNDDEQWAMVKDGRRAGFSIHGKGSRVQKALEIDE